METITQNSKSLECITWGTTSFIVLIAIIVFCYIKYAKKRDKLVRKRRWIENLPSLVSTLGVIGTFLGITIGLINFDTQNLDESIPLLLEGLKTAFFTSLAGMICSLILTHTVSADFDQKDEGVSDINLAANEIVKAVKEMSTANKETIEQLRSITEQQSRDQLAFYNTTSETLQKMLSSSSQTQTDISSMRLQFSSLNAFVESMLQSVGNVEEQTGKLQMASTSILPHIDNSIGEVVDSVSGILTTQEEVANEVKSFGHKLHGEVTNLEEKMNETNNLLEKKFDEFTELLKKSNTEALVEVMKNVTEEFQKQMNTLIGKLIQENFEKLNTSVERLNTWQLENKEMIASLTKQYKDMATNFESTSVSLTKVKDDTQSLVSEGGKLGQLVNSLNEIIVKDENFKKITHNLTDTVSLTKSNMAMFEESTRSLNDWVHKQRNFVDSVQMLIEKLEELNKIKDYGEHFWKDTKEKMEEGVSYISDGTKQLNQQLTALDQRFYERLSATLAELDTCIQAMVNDDRR